MRGVEPLSESIAMQLSPSAADILYFGALLPIGGLQNTLSRRIPLAPPGYGTKVSCKCRPFPSCRKGEEGR